MHRSSFMVASLLLAGLGAGCLGNDAPDYAAVAREVEAAAFDLLVQDHGDARGHFDAAAHAGAFNIELVGYHNGVDESGDPNAINAVAPDGYYTELAITPNYAYLSRQSASGAYGGFVILNLRDDPAHPRFVGQYAAPGSADIEVSADETLAFFATQRNLPDQLVTGLAGSPSPSAALPRGIHVVDISDKTSPTLASFFPLPVNGPHTLTYHQHANGSEYVIACTYDLLSSLPAGGLAGVIPLTQRVLVLQVVRGGDGAVLVPVSQYTIPEQGSNGKMIFPHDTRVQVHPTWQGGDRTLLYIAYWDKGLRILDFSDPANLVEVGATTDFAPSQLNNLHLAQPFDLPIAGRHVTVAQPEIPQAEGETGQLTFFDTTDPASPTKLGHWTLPAGPQGQLGVMNFDFSPHNFDTWNGKVAVGHFHAGVWVLDVHDERNLRSPKAVGYYMPAFPRDASPVHQPNVWGVFEQDGLLYAVDEATGLYVLRYTGP
jgi:hypothetical protein